MKDHPETPEPKPHDPRELETVRGSIGLTLSGEAALYMGTFVILCTLGAAVLVIHEVANATGSPADTAHSIITNLWHAGAAALVLTLAAAGISKATIFVAGRLRRLLSRMGRRGKREYVQVLRLLETFSQQEVAAAVKDALRLGAISFDAVKHLVLCRFEGRPPKLDLELVSLPAQGAGQHHVCRGLHDSPHREGGMNDRPTLLLEHHLKELKLPTFLREYGKICRRCAAEGVDHPQYLLRLAELELIDRHQRMVERRIHAARFPAVKSLDTFDFRPSHR